MDKFYRCNKCGGMIAKIDETQEHKGMCTSNLLMPARRICGGSFTIEMTVDEVREQFIKWGKNDSEIAEFLN